MGYVVGYLVSEHSRQSRLSLTDIKYAGENKDFAARDHESVLLLIFDNVHFPVVGFGRKSRMRNESIQNTLDKFVLRMRWRQDTVFVFLNDLLVQLLARLLFCAGRDDVEAPATRDLCNRLTSYLLSNLKIAADNGPNLQVRLPSCMHRSHQPG